MSSVRVVRVTGFRPVLMTRTLKVNVPPGSFIDVGTAVFSTAMVGRIGVMVTRSRGSSQRDVLGR
jgi:hypothetical protein